MKEQYVKSNVYVAQCAGHSASQRFVLLNL